MLHVGDVLDNLYEIQEEIGSGGGGVIYKAEHIRLKKAVAISLIKEQIKPNLNVRGEADILKKLKHTYLPQVYDFVVDGDDVYTVIDFVPGDSFDHLLKKHRHFNQKQVLKWAKQMCEALTYLHTQKPSIIHSDIKPANVMLTPDDDICLIDFNISLIFDAEQASALGFSKGYSAPELFWRTAKSQKSFLTEDTEPLDSNIEKTELLNDEATEVLSNTELLDSSNLLNNKTALLIQQKSVPEIVSQKHEPSISETPLVFQKGSRIDERSDIYSLGATLYHLLTGQKPMTDANWKCTWDDKLNIGDGIKYIIEKSMAQSPKDRFQSADEMLKAINNIYRLDSAYRRYVAKQWIISIVYAAFLAAFIVTAKLGWDVMKDEKFESYLALVTQSDLLSSEKKYSEALNTALQAQQLCPNQPGGYKAQALALFRNNDYDECLSFLERIQAKFTNYNDERDMESFADLYFIKANIFFEEEQYEKAIPEYQNAIKNNYENSEYYRDYAISQIRAGYVEQAKKTLETAIALNLDDVSVLLVQGELSLAENEYIKAEKIFKSIIQKADNDYVIERSYLICAKTYELGNEVFSNSADLEIQLLEEGVKRLPIEKSMALTEKLGKCYSVKAQETGNDEYYKKAAQCFNALLDTGYGRFYILNNLAILYQNMGDNVKANEVLQEMEHRFPNDYRVYMQKAFLYAEIESQKPIAAREYSDFKISYDKTKKLYEERKTDNTDDVQMQMLDGLMRDLQDGDWIK